MDQPVAAFHDRQARLIIHGLFNVDNVQQFIIN